MAKNKELQRLDKFLSGQLNISRNDAKELIKKRLVTVNGVVARLYDQKVDTACDKVVSEGKEVIYRKHLYIMMNKPQGVVCSTRDGESETVLELLPPELQREGLFPAGRLDKDTEGFVFITDDGVLAHNILSPKKHVSKVYFARLEKEADDSYIEAFENGLEIDGGDVCLPAKIEILDDRHEVYITIKEGMYHQIKRMAEALDNKIVYLRRIKIGGVELDHNLELGQCREMLHKEIENIYTDFLP
ncbi:MAG: rRNA pseudouridine synthase [Oscillospiraceae bacterium]|nr:rRNA pseudouridine synthase [Oscillospiraceae bacterium]